MEDDESRELEEKVEMEVEWSEETVEHASEVDTHCKLLTKVPTRVQHGARFARLKLITGNPKLKTAVLHHKYQTKVQFRTDKKKLTKSDILRSKSVNCKTAAR